MTAILPSTIDDIVKLTISHYKRDINDLSQEYSNYYAMDLLQDSSRLKPTSGVDYKFPLQIDNNRNTQLSGMYATVTTSQKALTVLGTEALTKFVTTMEYDIDEPAFQRGNGVMIADYLDTKIRSVYTDYAEYMEEQLWGAPTSSSQTPMPLKGIPYWIQKNSTAAYNRYGGVDPSGFSAGRAGVSSTTYSKWANGTFRYTDVTSADLFAKMRTANMKSNFQAPHNMKAAFDKPGGSDICYYTTERVVNKCSQLLEARNENLGVDLAKYDGEAVFMGRPIKFVDYLDVNDTTDPIYKVDWTSFKFLYIKERYMEFSDPMVGVDRPSVRLRYMSAWTQLVCENLRKNWVAYLTS
jgi:hypothetical protein